MTKARSPVRVHVVVELDLVLVGPDEVPGVLVLDLGECLAAHVRVRARVAARAARVPVEAPVPRSRLERGFNFTRRQKTCLRQFQNILQCWEISSFSTSDRLSVIRRDVDSNKWICLVGSKHLGVAVAIWVHHRHNIPEIFMLGIIR